MSEKTEQPTPQRLRKAREQGDAGASPALAQAAGFIATLALVAAAARATAGAFTEMWLAASSGRAASTPELASTVLALTLPLLAAAAFASGAIAFAQTGGLVSFRRITPDLKRLDVVAGAKSLVSAQRLFTVFRALFAGIALLAVAWVTLRAALPSLTASSGELGAATSVAVAAARRVAFAAAAIGLAFAGLDALVARRAWLKRWMMTRDEVRQELRDSEGDPELRAARRRAHQELLTSATISAVKNASVLIVNPTHLAVALRYDRDEERAPQVLAQGAGDLARRMIEAAVAYGVPVIRDVPVARALTELEVGDEIPEALYEAVAAILSEVFEAETK